MSDKGDNDDQDKKKEPTFPEGYEYLDDLIKGKLNRRAEIDKQLQAASKDRSKPNHHTLKYSPPGFTTGPSGNKERQMEQWKAEKTQIEADINESVELQMNVLETDPETAAQIRQTLMDKMYPNPFEGKGEKELQRVGKVEKDINSSQDYMRVQLKNFREGTPKDPKSPEDIQKESDQTEKDLGNSQEFMQRQIDVFRARNADKPSRSLPKRKRKSNQGCRCRQSFRNRSATPKHWKNQRRNPRRQKGKRISHPTKINRVRVQCHGLCFCRVIGVLWPDDYR
ncbi:MAG: hypothetical protein R2822_08650 [Spirosomataceae bacterium]